MSTHPLDNPIITSMLFYPHADRPENSHIAGAVDGSIPVEDGALLGYRFYVHQADAPVILYFHGNGEIANDYDGIARLFFEIGRRCWWSIIADTGGARDRRSLASCSAMRRR